MPPMQKCSVRFPRTTADKTQTQDSSSRWTGSAPRKSNSLVTPISSLLSALNNFVSISSALALNLQFELLSAQGVSSGGTRSNKVYKTWLGHSVICGFSFLISLSHVGRGRSSKPSHVSYTGRCAQGGWTELYCIFRTVQ